MSAGLEPDPRLDAIGHPRARALAAYPQDDLLRLDSLVDEIEALGLSHRFHATRLRSVPQRKDEAKAVVAAELIQVLDKLERGTP